jgi:hypothetical protein
MSQNAISVVDIIIQNDIVGEQKAKSNRYEIQVSEIKV